MCVCVCVCVCVVSVVVKRPVLPPCAVDGRSRNLLLLLLRIIIIIFYLKEVRTRSCGNFRISDANTLCSFIMPIHLDFQKKPHLSSVLGVLQKHENQKASHKRNKA